MGLLHLYGESDNPRCGMTRQSSKFNWNLVKADLGRVRRVTQNIRDRHFIYGRPNERGALGVKEVIVHLETVAAPQAERYGPDFRKMNKAATIQDGNFDAIIGHGYGDAWIDMNQYFASKYPERYTEAPARMGVITNKATELSKSFVRSRIHRPPPKKRFVLSRFQNVPKRIDNENQTPLNRSPPFHKFYGIPRQNNKVPCGIHKQ